MPAPAPERPYAALVVGGGVLGLATLEALSRRGLGPLALCEAGPRGHERGSSHGTTRIFRCSYPDELYVRLATLARAESWPRLERDAGARLLHPSPGCLFGPAEGPFERYAAAVARAGAEVERLDPAAAARRFRDLRFDGAVGALDDRTAAVIGAADTLATLRRLAGERGAELLHERAVSSIAREADLLRVDTLAGPLRAERVVVAAGAWSGRLVPALAPRLGAHRQRVRWFEYSGDARVGSFPLWARLGAGEDDFHYGLPSWKGEGLKVARHRTAGAGVDPDAPDVPPEGETEALRALLGSVVTGALGACAGEQDCLYTVAPGEDFRLDRAPGLEGVVFGAGLSGHGFKFAPLLGELLAGLALGEEPRVAELVAARARFALDAPRGDGVRTWSGTDTRGDHWSRCA